MSNALLTVTQITREALRVLHNNIIFARHVNKQYNDEFAKKGAKIGTTLNVRMPNRYTVRDQQQMKTQQVQETYVPVTISHQWGVDLNFSSVERTLTLDDFSKRILQPAMMALASKIDYVGLGEFIHIFNQVGTPGQTPGTAASATGIAAHDAPTIFLNAGAMLNSMACPTGNRRMLLDEWAQAKSVGGLSGLTNPAKEISAQYRNGVMGHALGFEFAMDQNVNKLLVGDRTGTASNFKVKGASQTGSTLTADWSDGTDGGVIKQGEIITLAGVYAVNPENQQSTGQLAHFVVTEDVEMTDASAGFEIPIYPPIIVADGGVDVANGTVTASPADDALITLKSGTASTSYPQNLAYHEDCFTLATADLVMPEGVDFASRQSWDGISMRIVRQYDINNDMFPCRVDVLGGYKTLRPELGCRVAG